MYIQNITFIVSPGSLPQMIERIHSGILPALLDNSRGAANPRLAEVLLPEGVADIEDQRSISLQIEFENPTLLSEWRENNLNPILAKLHDRFGEEVLAFPTVLKTIPL